MASDAPLPETLTADRLRESVAYWVVGKRAHSTQIVHLPAPETSRKAPHPACEHRERATRGGGRYCGWVAKSPAVYPPGYVSLCQDCARFAAHNLTETSFRVDL